MVRIEPLRVPRKPSTRLRIVLGLVIAASLLYLSFWVQGFESFHPGFYFPFNLALGAVMLTMLYRPEPGSATAPSGSRPSRCRPGIETVTQRRSFVGDAVARVWPTSSRSSC